MVDFCLFAFSFFSCLTGPKTQMGESRKMGKCSFPLGRSDVSRLQREGPLTFLVFQLRISCNSAPVVVSEHSDSMFCLCSWKVPQKLVDVMLQAPCWNIIQKTKCVFWLFFSRPGKLVTCFYYGSPWYAWFLLTWLGLMEIFFLKKVPPGCQQWIAYLK